MSHGWRHRGAGVGVPRADCEEEGALPGEVADDGLLGDSVGQDDRVGKIQRAGDPGVGAEVAIEFKLR